MGPTNRIVAGVAALIFLAGCRSSSKPNPSSKKHLIADQRMEKMQLRSYGPEGLEWELDAPQAEGYSNDGTTVVTNLKVDLYNHSQKSTTVTANKGILFSGTKEISPTLSTASVVLLPGDMLLSGNVVMISTEGNHLQTDWAHYKKKEDLIVSTAPVTVERPDSITHGVGLEATTDLSHIRIFNQTLVIPAKNVPKK